MLGELAASRQLRRRFVKLHGLSLAHDMPAQPTRPSAQRPGCCETATLTEGVLRCCRSSRCRRIEPGC